jgi:putative peptidoglycan lipid II flippase
VNVFGLLSRRLAAVHVNHRRIASGALTVGMLVLTAKVVSAGREVVIASRFGIGETVDAFNLAVTLTTWLPMMIVSIAISVLVPRLIALQSDPPQRFVFVRELNATSAATATIGLLLTLLAGPTVATWIAQDLSASTRREVAWMTLQLSPLAFLTVATGYLSIRLQAREQFAYSALEALPAAGLITLVLILPPTQGSLSLIAGTLIGAALQIVVLARMTHLRDGPIGRLSMEHTSRVWTSVYAGLGTMALGQVAMGIMAPVDQAVAARLGDGTVATLGYANRLIGLATSLGTVVIGRALLPIFSSIAAEGDLQTGRMQTLKWTWIGMAIGTMAALLGWVVAPMLVKALFERGAFTASDTESVVLLFQAGMVQLPFFLGGMVTLQWLAANNEFPAILTVALVATVSKLISLVLLVYSLGARGIMLSNAVMYLFTISFMVLRLRKTYAKPA